MLPRRPKFTIAAGTWEASLPCHPWTLAEAPIGGRAESAAGFPAAFIVRHDALVELRIRFRETEWEAVRAIVAAGQECESILWYPDATVDESIPVWLELPEYGQDWRPDRLENLPQFLELDLVLRAQDNAELWRKYFEVTEFVTVDGEIVTVDGDPVTVTG